MNSNTNPILKDFSRQLPKHSQTLQFVQESKSYVEIALQARREISCLRNLECVVFDDQTGESILKKSGYNEWLKDFEDEDRLRLIGVLKLIVDFCEESGEE